MYCYNFFPFVDFSFTVSSVVFNLPTTCGPRYFCRFDASRFDQCFSDSFSFFVSHINKKAKKRKNPTVHCVWSLPPFSTGRLSQTYFFPGFTFHLWVFTNLTFSFAGFHTIIFQFTLSNDILESVLCLYAPEVNKSW